MQDVDDPSGVRISCYFSLTLWVRNILSYFVPSAEFVYVKALLLNTTSEFRLLSTYT